MILSCLYVYNASVSTQPQPQDPLPIQVSTFTMTVQRRPFPVLLGRPIVSTPSKMRRILQTVQHLHARRQLEGWESERIRESEERIEGLHHAHLIEWLHNSTPVDYGPQYCAVCKMWLRNSAQMESHCRGQKHRMKQRRALETAPWRSVTLEARNDSV